MRLLPIPRTTVGRAQTGEYVGTIVVIEYTPLGKRLGGNKNTRTVVEFLLDKLVKRAYCRFSVTACNGNGSISVKRFGQTQLHLACNVLVVHAGNHGRTGQYMRGGNQVLSNIQRRSAWDFVADSGGVKRYAVTNAGLVE